ncbi:MAG: type II toxin-antitoxin system HipA family toxin [Venatoribacter sp.]
MVTEVISVHFHEHEVGAASFDSSTGIGYFEYAPKFLASGLELAPLTMPLSPRIYSFAGLNIETFKGLPGLLADSLPDDFGNAVLNAWAAAQGMSASQITPLQRLQYTGSRGMGALEYRPATQIKSLNAAQKIALDVLLETAQQVLNERADFNQSIVPNRADSEAMLALLSVGTSAGGARPKAVLAFNQDFTQVRSGQVEAAEGFSHYLLKFDGVSDKNSNQETFGDPLGFGVMEYVYYLMATSCGIDMMPCHLLEEGSRRHFLTQRFDREENNKIHVQTLTGLAHVDYKRPGSYSYAELFALARQLKLPAYDAEQLLKRLVFNLVARNHDDHAKNFSFMLKEGRWRLAPAYDLAYSYKPGSPWVNSHWMSLNGKRDGFNRADLYSLERLSPLFSRSKIDAVLAEVLAAVSQWPKLSKEWQVPVALQNEVHSNLRLSW